MFYWQYYNYLMYHEAKALAIKSSFYNKIISFFDKTIINDEIKDHYHNALEQYKKEGNEPKIIEMTKKLIGFYNINDPYDSRIIAEHNFELGTFYLKKNNFLSADTYYKNVLLASNKPTNYLDNTNKYLEKIGNEYFKISEYKLALEYYHKIPNISNQEKIYNNVYEKMIICYLKLNDYSGALTIANYICEMHNNNKNDKIRNILSYMKEQNLIFIILCNMLINTNLAMQHLKKYEKESTISNCTALILTQIINKYIAGDIDACKEQIRKRYPNKIFVNLLDNMKTNSSNVLTLGEQLLQKSGHISSKYYDDNTKLYTIGDELLSDIIKLNSDDDILC